MYFCGLYKEFVEDRNGESLRALLAAIGLVTSLYYKLIYLKLSNVSNSSIIDDVVVHTVTFGWIYLRAFNAFKRA